MIMRRLRRERKILGNLISKFNKRDKNPLLSKLRRSFNRRQLKIDQLAYDNKYRGVIRRSDSQFSRDKRKALKVLNAKKKGIKLSMKKVKYTGTLTLDLDLTSSKFELRRSTVTIDVRNKTRKQIVKMIKKEKKRYLGNKKLKYSDREYVTVSFPDQALNDDLTFLTESWQLMPISKINHGNGIVGYEALYAKIPQNLNDDYAKHEFKNCFPVYVKNYLKRVGSHDNAIYDMKMFDSGYYELPKHGITIEEIHDYFVHINVTYYAVNAFDDIISHYVSKNSRFLMMTFAICNNHIYPICDTFKRRSLSRRCVSKKYLRKFDGNKTRPDIDQFTVYEGKLEHMFIESVKLGIIPSHTMIDNKFQAVDGMRLVDNDIREIWQACSVMGTKYKMSSGAVLSDHLHKYPKSTLNPDVAKVINNITKVGKCVKFSHFNPGTKHIDVKREYTSQLINMKNWFKFMPYAQIEEFNGKLKNRGFYYIKTKDRKLFNGDNWYFGQLLIEAKKDKIKFVCERQLIASYCVSNDSEHVVKFANAKYIDDCVKKKGVNHMIGSFRRTKKDARYTTITNDLSCVKEMIDRYDAEVVRRRKFGMYHVTRKVTTEYKSNRQFIFFQIVDMCMLKVYRKMKKLKKRGAIIRSIVTDGIYFDDPKDIIKHRIKNKHCKIGYWGEDKISEKSEKAEITKFVSYNETPPLTYKKNNGSVLITGRPGTGKSTMLKEVHKSAGSKIPIMAYTNKASRNVDGITLNTYFCGEVLNRSAIFEEEKTYYVDEIYCCPIDLLCHLYICSTYGKCELMCAGDKNQLIIDFDESVSKYKHMKLKAIIKLIDYMCTHKYNLTTLHRYDSELAEATKDHLKPDLSKCTFLKKIPINTQFRHLVYTNKKRYQINNMYYDAGMNDLDETPYISKKTIKKNKKKTGTYSKNEIYTLLHIKQCGWAINDFEVAWATTVHKAQGETILGNICIHEIEHMIKNHRLGYTAMTRATALKNLYRV